MWLTTVFFQIWCLCWAFLLMRWGTFFCLTLTQLMLRSDWRRSCQRGTERMRCSSHGMGTRVPCLPGKDSLANPRMAPVSSSSCEWHNYLMIDVHARAFRTPACHVFIAVMFRFGCPVLWIEMLLSCQYGTRLSKWYWIRKNVMNWYLRRNFSSKNLQGQIPAAIGNLTDLTEMYVSLSDFRNKFMLW